MAVARCLSLLGRHAVDNTGAFGDVLLEARVIGANLRLAYLFRIGPVAMPEEIDEGRTINGAVSPHTLPLRAIAGSAQDLLSATRLVATDLFNAFGSPEVRHLAPDGTLRVRYFPGRIDEVRRFAEEDGIPVSDEPAPGE
jgi:hypothetical protein